MQSAKAFAPANISCVFVIRKTENPATSGSLGMGFTVNKGVIATISKAHSKDNESIVYFNDKKINFPAVNYVIGKLARAPVEARIKTGLPLGCGFGLSGASSLASAYALNKLFSLKKSKKSLAFIAHMADAASSSGLGDVINQYYGGVLVKYESSCNFEAVRLPIADKAVYCKYFGPIETKKIISDKKLKKKINKAGVKALEEIRNLKELNLENLIKVSKKFSVNSGLLKDKNAISLINEIELGKGNASMIMLGNAVFSDTYFKGSEKLIISEKAACLL